MDKQPAIREALAALLNRMMVDDFAGLVQLLYRVDVPEEKLRAVLKQHPGTDAGELLADLLLERQAQKEKGRSHGPVTGESEEERW